MPTTREAHEGLIREQFGDEDLRTEPAEDAAAPNGLVLLHGTQVSLEKARIAVGNRVHALERESDFATSEIGRLYIELHKGLIDWEARIEDAMTVEARTFPVYDLWLSHVKGIGPSLASQLLAMLKPPLEQAGPSTWYKAAGLTIEWATPDGKLVPAGTEGAISRLPRARAGREGLPYYPRLRRCLFNVATSFVRNGGYYREVYDRRKERLSGQHGGDTYWPAHRVDAVARWQTIKLFLSHLYEMWLEAEGRTGRKAYVLEVLGHTHYIAPPRWGGNGKL